MILSLCSSFAKEIQLENSIITPRPIFRPYSPQLPLILELGSVTKEPFSFSQLRYTIYSRNSQKTPRTQYVKTDRVKAYSQNRTGTNRMKHGFADRVLYPNDSYTFTSLETSSLSSTYLNLLRPLSRGTEHLRAIFKNPLKFLPSSVCVSEDFLLCFKVAQILTTIFLI